MRAEINRTDDNGVYVLFTEDAYAVEEFHTFEDLASLGYDGTDETLTTLLAARILFRKMDKAAQEVPAPEQPTVGFFVEE